MKRYLIGGALATCTIIILAIIFMFGQSCKDIDVHFATHVYCSLPSSNCSVSVEISDPQDVSTLKDILSGTSYVDIPSPEFSDDYFLTFTDDKSQNTVTVYPSLNKETILRVGKDWRFLRISEDNREVLNNILAKYDKV